MWKWRYAQRSVSSPWGWSIKSLIADVTVSGDVRAWIMKDCELDEVLSSSLGFSCCYSWFLGKSATEAVDVSRVESRISLDGQCHTIPKSLISFNSEVGVKTLQPLNPIKKKHRTSWDQRVLEPPPAGGVERVWIIGAHWPRRSLDDGVSFWQAECWAFACCDRLFAG